MNSRERALVSTATVFGALASAIACRFLLSNPKKQSPKLDSSENGAVPRKYSSQSPCDPSKRQGYLSWDDYFMAIAFLSAERSKDPNRQELGIMGSQEVVRTTSFLGQSYVCHAEVNANPKHQPCFCCGTEALCDHVPLQ